MIPAIANPYTVRSLARLSILCASILLSAPARISGHARSAEAASGVGSAAVVAEAVTEDATSSNNEVKMVRDPAVGLVVAYVENAGGTAQVVLAASRDQGRRWSLLARASGGAVPSRLPALALDRIGRLHVIWTRYDDGVGKIYYRAWQGGWAAPQARISPAPGYAGFPSLALDERGHPQVVWYGIRGASQPASTRHGSIYEIFYTGFDGRAWSPPRLVSTGLPDSVNPALAADRTGRLRASWYQSDGRVYQVRYAERTAAWGEPETVLATRSDAFNPDIAVDPEGQAALTWEQHDGLASAIRFTRRVGGRWEDPAVLSDGRLPAHHPSVSVAPSGVICVAWDRDDGEILVRRFDGRWEPAVRAAVDEGNSFPSVLASDQGADVIWTHTAQGRSQVRYVRLGAR